MAGTTDAPQPDRDDGGRRAQLLALKLRALVREQLGHDIPDAPERFPSGAALMADGAAWVLLDDDAPIRLGGALAWAVRHGAGALNVIAGDGTGVLARRADAFRFPISVWFADERVLLPAVADPVVLPPAPRPEHLELVELIEAGGATPVVEHGVVFGEVRGLEVCRVVDDPHLGVVRLEVGVGVHDREAFQMIHGDVPTIDALAGVVDAVTRHRSPDVPQHPLNRLARERYLRLRLEQQPSLVGAATLAPGQPPVERTNVRDPVPCVAVGTDAGGEPLIVVCSTGVDLDVVPYAADARLAGAGSGVGGGEGRTLIAVPSRDRMAVTTDLASLLVQPVEVVSVD